MAATKAQVKDFEKKVVRLMEKRGASKDEIDSKIARIWSKFENKDKKDEGE